MRVFEAAYRAKLDYLQAALGPGCVSIPAAAKFIGMRRETLRDDPTLPKIMVGSRARVSIDSLARWMVDREYKKGRA